MIRTLEEAEAHQRKHGFLAPLSGPGKKGDELCDPVADSRLKIKKSRMNKTEAEYALILEAMKRRGEIVSYRPFGMTLEWGIDPKTNKPMRYKPDFVVVNAWADVDRPQCVNIKIVEIKGAHIWAKDLIRFKGCRAEWPVFEFEMHQKKGGQWQRIH